MEAIIACNEGIAASYGEDYYTRSLEDRLSVLFEKAVRVFPVVSGTVANALSLVALTPPYGKIYCHEMSHINTDECGAPEFFTHGAKLIAVQSTNGKIDPGVLQEIVRGKGNVHSAQPATLSLTQSSEVGMVYQLDEIKAIADVAHSNGMHVHMDGARFANALVSLDVSPADMTWRCGVDVLSFGGTKNGCMAAEAVVFLNPDLVGDFAFLHKRAGQLISKMRFVSAQLLAYVTDDVWLRNARHANAMAQKLSQGLEKTPGVELAYPNQANEVFAHLPATLIEQMNQKGFNVNQAELDSTAPPRFVTAWNTTEEEVDFLLSAIGQSLSDTGDTPGASKAVG